MKPGWRYFPDTDRREVDFVVTERRQPIRFVECKLGDRDIDPGLKYPAKRFPLAEAWQISLDGRKDYVTDAGIRSAPALTLLRELV